MPRTSTLIAPALLLAAAAALARPAPPPSNYQYRASGTEPFWTLTIDPARLVFTDRGTGTSISEATPSSAISSNGESYRSGRLAISVTHTDCSNGMSDETYGDTVEVSVDGGKPYRGCGGVFATPRSIVGTSWQVLAVNGRDTPAARRQRAGMAGVDEDGRRRGKRQPRAEDLYTLSFDAKGRFTGLLGCNRLSSRYTANGWNVSVAQPLAATRKACPDMSFETSGSGILARPFAVQLLENERGTLTGAGGTMALRRIY
ncbi:META domain-containing protein [Sphingomonas ginkgonis]|nr:META domain-containing protein [Sphingomonas ginkgonis]